MKSTTAGCASWGCRPPQVTECELSTGWVATVSATGYSEYIGAERFHHSPPAMTAPTFAQAAADLSLWREWFDPDVAVSDEEFYSMTTEQRIDLLSEVWGDD